ncbi:hypothetical protein D910_10184 [Dendroctonus ponderosae]|uniref:Plectin/eS10 N-terminal domain-containing protein n=1 Tax=Dendroctonus ponderosae TaxID=77166 RepID=U4UK90_DENPD|nr:hypothetical protein D910_10184 [Dendroctonus ponderosae]
MLMPKENRVAIFEHLFREGVMVAKKDYHAPKHMELQNIPNLQVIKALQSLKSKGYVKEQFAWRHFYWYLTNTGIEYLRTFLHLPSEIVPSTLKRQARTESARPRPAGAPRSDMLPKGTEDRTGYSCSMVFKVLILLAVCLVLAQDDKPIVDVQYAEPYVLGAATQAYLHPGRIAILLSLLVLSCFAAPLPEADPKASPWVYFGWGPYWRSWYWSYPPVVYYGTPHVVVP